MSEWTKKIKVTRWVYWALWITFWVNVVVDLLERIKE